MSFNEIAIIVACLVAGYWAVSKYLEQRDDPTGSKAQEGSQSTFNNFGNKEEPISSSRSDPEYVRTNWALILGVSSSATSLEISSAYRTKMSQYHPDKCASLGPELRELAELKAKQINTAYDYAKYLKG